MNNLGVAVLISATIAWVAPATSYAQSNGQGETQGACRSHAAVATIIGGGVGALLGNKLAGSGKRALGTAIGGGAGAAAALVFAKAAMSNCERAVARDAAIQTARTGQTTRRVAPEDQGRMVTASLAENQSSASQACRVVEYALADDASEPEQVEVCEVAPGDWQAMG